MPVLGVIGRWPALRPEDLRAGVDEILDHVGSRFGGGPVAIIALPVDAATQFVVRRVLDRRPGSTLVVPLPFARSALDARVGRDWSGDLAGLRTLLARARYVLHLPAPCGAPLNEALALSGRFILDRAQVLIAPQADRGVDDPTGDLVRLARASEIPIAWVHDLPPQGGATGATAADDPIITFEGFSGHM